jgi:hypothetical protein
MLGDKEEAERKSRELADLHRVDPRDEAKARRDFSEAARSRVLAAAERQVEVKERRLALEAGGEMGDAMANEPKAASPDIDAMVIQRRALLDVGLADEADKVAHKLAEARASMERERLELEESLVSQRLVALEAQQKEKRDSLLASQAAAREQAEQDWRDEIVALLAQQADEVDQFELLVAKAAALEEVCTQARSTHAQSRHVHACMR